MGRLMLRRKVLKSGAALSVLALSGCASFQNEEKETVEIETNPEGAFVTITNRSGKTIFTGKTPIKESLERAQGYFKGEIYSVHIEKAGYQAADLTITSKNNAWYVFGNTLAGFIPGWLGVDPKSYRMYELHPIKISLRLVPLES